MKYAIVQKGDIEKLAERVNNHIGEGWKPLGGVAIAVNSSGERVYAQAMTKEE